MNQEIKSLQNQITILKIVVIILSISIIMTTLSHMIFSKSQSDFNEAICDYANVNSKYSIYHLDEIKEEICNLNNESIYCPKIINLNYTYPKTYITNYTMELS